MLETAVWRNSGGFATRKSAEAAMPIATGRMRCLRREEFFLDIAQAAVHIYGQETRYADPD